MTVTRARSCAAQGATADLATIAIDQRDPAATDVEIEVLCCRIWFSPQWHSTRRA